MKKIILTLCLTVALSAPALAESNYEKFTTNLASKAITIVTSSADDDKKVDEFTELFLDNCDLHYIGRFVLGQYWKGLEKEKQDDFLEAFTNSVIMSWAVKFNAFHGGTLKINSVARSENPNSTDYFVNSTMTFKDGTKPAEVIWRERMDKEGSIKVIDIVIEGISMAMSYRNEYRAVLQRNSGDVADLIVSLNQKAKNLRREFEQ